MHFLVSIAVAVGCGLGPWAATRLPTRAAAIAAAPLLVVMVVGAVASADLYPYSDVVVVVFSVLAGIVLGRVVPPRFRPLFVLLLLLSVLDVAQNVATSSPTSSQWTGYVPQADGRDIWLNFRIPLGTADLNIGFADLLLIAAVSEQLRRRASPLPLALLPGVISLGLGEALAASLPQPAPAIGTALSNSLVPFLTLGYVLAELAVGQAAREA